MVGKSTRIETERGFEPRALDLTGNFSFLFSRSFSPLDNFPTASFSVEHSESKLFSPSSIQDRIHTHTQVKPWPRACEELSAGCDWREESGQSKQIEIVCCV
ncbi:hypothetical protein F2P79_000174 [Pimephales promelas]|nr:hypothetical protein F2P79_000174 [Pimephales promelas]